MSAHAWKGRREEWPIGRRVKFEDSEKRPKRVLVESDTHCKAVYHCDPNYGIFI